MRYVYGHLPQLQDVGDEGRQYSVTEGMLEYAGRQVLYHYAEALGVTFCTGSYVPCIGSITVQGYVLNWKYGTNEKGEAISDIDPIADAEDRAAISRLLWPGHGFPRVTFL